MHNATRFLLLIATGLCLASFSAAADDTNAAAKPKAAAGVSEDTKGATLLQKDSSDTTAPAETKPAAAAQTEKPAEAKEAKPAEASTVSKTNAPAKKMTKPEPVKFAPIAGPASPLSEDKQQRLKDLLDQYKNDKITAEEYHNQRAKILAGP